jgi:hypothetical protein
MPARYELFFLMGVSVTLPGVVPNVRLATVPSEVNVGRE